MSTRVTGSYACRYFGEMREPIIFLACILHIAYSIHIIEYISSFMSWNFLHPFLDSDLLHLAIDLIVGFRFSDSGVSTYIISVLNVCYVCTYTYVHVRTSVCWFVGTNSQRLGRNSKANVTICMVHGVHGVPEIFCIRLPTTCTDFLIFSYDKHFPDSTD